MQTFFNFTKALCLIGLYRCVLGLKLVILGDSTVNTNQCLSNIVGHQEPPSPPYSNLTRYSSYKVWVDYFPDVYGGDLEIVDCSCSGTLVSIQDPRGVPSLVTQVQNCLQNYGPFENKTTIAIVSAGGNDLFLPTFAPSFPAINPQLFGEAFYNVTALLAKNGFQKIFLANTVMQSFFAPYDTTLKEMSPEAFRLGSSQRTQLLDVYWRIVAELQQDYDDGVYIVGIPLSK
eukprot:TRINITY_DN42055_c0_g1_i3.p1 TRINITY_DN42055_c0_g1~~TRINITY_DN42055_c0_g1_i3.p1  ORF type:complete len:249 (+),score=15.53 TRINITY_DN42055_c0_g1_i3:56-748(+)